MDAHKHIFFFLWQLRNFKVFDNQVIVEYNLAKDIWPEKIYSKENLYELKTEMPWLDLSFQQ